jgi:tRNA G26 N,N-dimethylase Trm1
MSYQYGLYQGNLQRDKALERVERNAQDEWKESAREVVEHLARIRPEFTTDAVWAMLENMGHKTHEPQAMRDIRVWRSLRCRESAA